MASQCKYKNCEAFARKLTGTEIKNLGGFNLTHEVCVEIFKWTLKGLCPYHAAQFLTEDVRPDGLILDAIARNWDYYRQDNFSHSRGYALCRICSESLAVDRGKHPVLLIEETLGSLYVPKQRIQTILWLQNKALGGLGTCFDCSVLMHVDCDYDGAGNLIETELDRLCRADM